MRRLLFFALLLAACDRRTEAAPPVVADASADAGFTGARGAYEELRAAACAGDADGVFALVDRQAIVDGAFPSVAGGVLGAAIEKAKRDQIAELLEEWTNQVARRDGGDLCKMRFESARVTGYGEAEIAYETPTGKKKLFRWSKRSGEWILTGIANREDKARPAASSAPVASSTTAPTVATVAPPPRRPAPPDAPPSALVVQPPPPPPTKTNDPRY